MTNENRERVVEIIRVWLPSGFYAHASVADGVAQSIMRDIDAAGVAIIGPEDAALLEKIKSNIPTQSMQMAGVEAYVRAAEDDGALALREGNSSFERGMAVGTGSISGKWIIAAFKAMVVAAQKEGE